MVKQNNQTFITGNCPGVIGWNEDTGDISKWQDFIIRVSPKIENVIIEETVAEAVEEEEPKEEIMEVKVPEVREEKEEIIEEKQKEKGLLESLFEMILKIFKK